MNTSQLLYLLTITLPGGWLMYRLSFRYLFQKAIRYRYSFALYITIVVVYCLVVFLSTSVVLAMYIEDEDFFISMGGITVAVLLFIQAPVQWFYFRRLTRNDEELFAIRKELGQTEANVDFLRSQINPHFLFNILNTLYGMAIHEKAERTSEAIEKLGSMMRFMLRENVQEKIALVRDTEYLSNYIALQRLRTDFASSGTIQVSIAQDFSPALQIAPMLLIPFIENAFKHGSSQREGSQIRISLEVDRSILYFDVFNTKHSRTENDPEKNNNGIGLENVRQRLQLIYRGKHELVIRETAHDYFVHLVIHL